MVIYKSKKHDKRKHGALMQKFLFIIFLASLFISCRSQSDKSFIKNWKSYCVPIDKNTLRKYGLLQSEWKVILRNDTARVFRQNGAPGIDASLPFKIKHGKNDPLILRGKFSLLKVDNGYLIGLYRGEWGGDLYWFSADGKKYYKISNDETIQFIRKGYKIYAIQGLSHMGISEGSIISIEKTGDTWNSKTYLKLPFAPYAIATDRYNNFIVITSENLLKIDDKNKITTLIKKGIWASGLYPNSVIIKDEVLFAGMRAGVYRYNLKSGSQDWLLPY